MFSFIRVSILFSAVTFCLISSFAQAQNCETILSDKQLMDSAPPHIQEALKMVRDQTKETCERNKTKQHEMIKTWETLPYQIAVNGDLISVRLKEPLSIPPEALVYFNLRRKLQTMIDRREAKCLLESTCTIEIVNPGDELVARYRRQRDGSHLGWVVAWIRDDERLDFESLQGDTIEKLATNYKKYDLPTISLASETQLHNLLVQFSEMQSELCPDYIQKPVQVVMTKVEYESGSYGDRVTDVTRYEYTVASEFADHFKEWWEIGHIPEVSKVLYGNRVYERIGVEETCDSPQNENVRKTIRALLAHGNSLDKGIIYDEHTVKSKEDFAGLTEKYIEPFKGTRYINGW